MAVPLRDLHTAVGWALIVSNGLVGVWALLAHRNEALRHRAMWIAVIIAQVTVLVQVGLGVWIQVDADIEGGEHQLYGFAAFASVGIIYAYRNEMRDRLFFLYGLGSLWLMGLGLRAVYLVN